MILQDFYPLREMALSIGQQSVANAQVDEHAEGDGGRITGFVNVVTAYIAGGRIFNFVCTFPVDIVLVVCEEEHVQEQDQLQVI